MSCSILFHFGLSLRAVHLFRGFTKSVPQPSSPKPGLKNSSQVSWVEHSWLDPARECPPYHCRRPSGFFFVPLPSLSSSKAQTKFLPDSWQVGRCLSVHEELNSVVSGNGFFCVVLLIGLSVSLITSCPSRHQHMDCSAFAFFFSTGSS